MLTGLYLHIPFCLAKCYYCDFNSFAGFGEKEKEEYLQALINEARSYSRLFGEAGVSAEISLASVYFGGGTPTCLSGGQLCFLFQQLRKIFLIEEEAEITIEGNPGTLDLNKLKALNEGGFNRLSLGIQSFRSEGLKILGRVHTVAESRQAVSMARKAGFINVGIDLMYGLPGQELQDWQANLQEALALAPEHISLYQLNIEEGTPFYQKLLKGELREFPDEQAVEMYEEARRILGEAGYHHYEISNFALPGRESRHNQLYWSNKEYLGLGSGAAGYWQGIRYCNKENLAEYIASVAQGELPRGEEEVIDAELQLAEAVFLGLRLTAGLNKGEFYQRYGVSLSERFGQTINKLAQAGLLADDSHRIFLTERGRNLANLVMMEFLP